MKNEKKRNSKRRILLLILLLVCTLILLGGSTYAWFTQNTKITVQPMHIEVQVANGIEISADAKNWGPRMTLNDLYKAAKMDLDQGQTSRAEDAGSVNQFPAKLKNLSGVGNLKANNRLELFNGVANNVCYDEYNTLKIVRNDELNLTGDNVIDMEDCNPASPIEVGLLSTSNYVEGDRACKVVGEGTDNCATGVATIAFDMYLKLDNNAVVYLAPGSYVNNEQGTDYGLKNTIRVAFITLGTQPSSFYYAEDKDIGNDANRITIPKTAGTGLTTEEMNQEGATVETSSKGRLVEVTEEGTVQLNASANVNKYNEVFGGFTGVYGARRMNAFGGIDIWEPNNNAHTTSGIANALKNYGKTIANGATDVTYGIHQLIPDAKMPIPLAQTIVEGDSAPFKDHFAKQESVTDEAKISTEKNEETGEIKTTAAKPYKNKVNYLPTSSGPLGSSQQLFAAVRGVTKVRVYIWIEGQDIDTENNATSSMVEAMLSFTTADHEPLDMNETTDSDLIETYTLNKDNVWRNGTDENITSPAVGTFTPTASEPTGSA